MSRSRPSPLTVLLVASAIAASACSGPRSPIDVTMKQVPSDILLGSGEEEAAVELAPPPALNPDPVGFPTFLQPPPPIPPIDDSSVDTTTTTSPPPPPRDPCPVADPLAAPAKPASRNVAGPPVAAALDYRNDGRYEVTEGDHTRSGVYPPMSRRTITVHEGDGGETFRFVVTELVVGASIATTATTYFVDPSSGIYLAAISTAQADGSHDSFTPADQRSLPILPLPASPKAAVAGRAVDPLTATTMIIEGEVVGKTKIDACGVPLDAWDVSIVGKVTSPNKQLQFSASYAIGTQYGGLSLADHVLLQCDETASVRCDNGRSIKSENVAVVSSEPALGVGAAGA